MDNIDKVDLSGIYGRYSDKSEMMVVPKGDPEILRQLNAHYSGAIIAVVGLKEDINRIRYEKWILDRDGDVTRYTFFEADGIYYSMVVVEWN
jgi:hypothetical protein